MAETEAEKQNPWILLEKEWEGGAIAALGDSTTVMWILHSGLGKELEIEDAAGRPVRLKIVGMFRRGSALQAELIISERNFLRAFPARAGHQFFFLEVPAEASPEAPAEQADEIRAILEEDLKAYGFDVFETEQRIDSYMAVENTYLSTFQVLGGLGLLLGTLGLAAVMLRNVLERRGELALLRSLGYRSSALAILVLSENGFLLLAGLAVGTISALIAVAPHVFGGGSAMPWGSLIPMLIAIPVVGMAAGCIAVVAALRAPLLQSLRSP